MMVKLFMVKNEHMLVSYFAVMFLMTNNWLFYFGCGTEMNSIWRTLFTSNRVLDCRTTSSLKLFIVINHSFNQCFQCPVARKRVILLHMLESEWLCAIRTRW